MNAGNKAIFKSHAFVKDGISQNGPFTENITAAVQSVIQELSTSI